MNKENELIVFTHNDLDALGCMLNIEYKFPNVEKKYFHTNYSNIKERVQEIEEYMTLNGNKHIFIVDVSFSDNKESLTKLYNLDKDLVLCDHHLYPDGFWDAFPEMKVQWDKTKSATLICNEYFGNKGKNLKLDNLSRVIDVYDIWQTEEPEFDLSQDLNEYFWTYDIAILLKKIIDNDYRLPSDFKEVVKNIKLTYNTAIEDYNKRGLIKRSGDVSLCFVKDWFNQVMLKEMDNGQNIVVGIDLYGIVRVRINKKHDLNLSQKQQFREILTGNPDIGHAEAFTYKYAGTPSFDKSIAEAEKVYNAIQKIKI